MTHIAERTTGFSSLVEMLQDRAQKSPNSPAFSYLNNGEVLGDFLTYSDLDKNAKAIAASLKKLDLVGERALMLYPPGLEFISAFFGCMYAGVIGVPVYPPRANRNLKRLEAVVQDSEAKIAITTSNTLTNIESLNLSCGLGKINWMTTNDIPETTAFQWEDNLKINPNTLAFLQYTSGSTGDPKGVMVSHGNLLHNLEMLKQGFRNDQDSKFLSWLPHFHDMGLISQVLQSVYLGVHCVMMSPADFIQKPYRWLKAISDYRITYSGGPNFAYDLLVNKITPEQLQTLDLSCWQSAFNGAEPVRYETMERFAEVFSKCGLKKEALDPCYGLAEGTLMVSNGLREAPIYKTISKSELSNNKIRKPKDEIDKQRIVSCGRSWLDQRIVIADPQTLESCPEDRVGEVWVKGPSVAQGYWNRPKKNKRDFQAFLTNTGDGPYLRTGDLGFMDGKNLYITGRLKDLIVIRGKNYYPQDIERVFEESHEAFKEGSSAAFTVEDEGESRLIVVGEVDRKFRRLEKEVRDDYVDVKKEWEDLARRAINEEFDLSLDDVKLIKPYTIPKTSSGKIQRNQTSQEYVDRTLELWGGK